MFPAGAWGKAPIVTMRSIKKQESGSEASPDSIPAALNRREAEKGCREHVPCWGLGQSPNRHPAPNKKRESGSEASPDSRPTPLPPFSKTFQSSIFRPSSGRFFLLFPLFSTMLPLVSSFFQKMETIMLQ